MQQKGIKEGFVNFRIKKKMPFFLAIGFFLQKKQQYLYFFTKNIFIYELKSKKYFTFAYRLLI
jgi:hypothetical protein